MKDSDDPITGLDAVPPHRRQLVARRIAVVKAYIADRRRGGVAAAAASLGMSPDSFRLLVRAWERTGSPMSVAGSGGLRRMPDALTPAQSDVIATAAAELPNAILERVAERAIEIAAERKVRMVGQAALIRHVAIAAVGRLPDASPAAGADLVVDHCVVDVGVAATPRGKGVMPFATLVLRVVDPVVLAVSISTDRPSAATTRDTLTAALARCRATSGDERALTIFARMLTGDDWDALAADIRNGGANLLVEQGPELSPPAPVIRLLGRNPGGIAIKARFGRRAAAARVAELRKGARPIAPDEASSFVRARWMPDKGPFAVEADRASIAALRAALGEAGS